MNEINELSSRRWSRFAPRHRLLCGPAPIIALVNVALLAGLFMKLDSAFVLRPGVAVELPGTDFVSGSAYGTMVVTLTQEGRVFFNDEWMPLEELAFAFKRAAHRKEQPSLVIEADARVPYGAVVEVINMAAEARILHVDLATRPFFAGVPSHESGAEQK